jgi:hypothetical protein
MKEFDWRKDMQDESSCNENPSKIWVNTYIKQDGTVVKGYCRDRTEHEIPHPPEGVKPYINTIKGRARYLRTEMDRVGDYRTKDGYYVLHNGKYHDIYVIE